MAGTDCFCGSPAFSLDGGTASHHNISWDLCCLHSLPCLVPVTGSTCNSHSHVVWGKQYRSLDATQHLCLTYPPQRLHVTCMYLPKDDLQQHLTDCMATNFKILNFSTVGRQKMKY